MTKVFEFGDSFSIPKEEKENLRNYLEGVWQQRFPDDNNQEIAEDDGEEYKGKQGFLSFTHDDCHARAKNYVGFIQSGDFHLEIFPKVFKEQENHDTNAKLFLKHLFFWFSYCRKWKFPFTEVNLDSLEHDNLPELIINLMANQIYETIATSPVSLYEEVEESLMTPRGRINFGRYIANGFSNGNQHILECDYEPLYYDNKLNRAIKFVARILYNTAKFDETRNKLNDIIFILNDVEDIPCTAKDLDKIKLNSFFTDYQDLINICRLVLEQQIYSNNHYEQQQWCLLFPMEYIFEDFVAGFLEYHFTDWKVEYQKSEMYLSSNPDVFQMQHDIYLTQDSKKIIIDTKYKRRNPGFKNEPKKGIAQSDLYQVTSYAYRRGCNHVLLLYPNYSEICLEPDTFKIISGFEGKNEINVIAAEIPFWSMGNFHELEDSFKKRLIELLMF